MAMSMMGINTVIRDIFHPRRAITPKESIMLMITTIKGINTPFHSLKEKKSINTINIRAAGSKTFRSFLIFPVME
jgi:hypothetical protein